MTQFQSEKKIINAPVQEVFNFLEDFNNFDHLMPEQIKNWKASKDQCSFTIEGLADLSMRIAGRTKNRNISIVADGKNPIDYTLDCFIAEKDENNSLVEIVFNADLNPFIKSVASRPLQNFVDMLANKLEQHFS